MLDEISKIFETCIRIELITPSSIGVLKIALDAPTGEVTGYVDGLNLETVRCSGSLRSNTQSPAGDTLGQRLLAKQSFNAVVAFGKRLEPWVLSIE
jgi:hypothetical protein